MEEVQAITEALQVTPLRRNVIALTRGLPLQKQISLAKEHNLDPLSSASVNKYLGYFSSMIDWAKRYRHVEDNLFEGIRVKNKNKNNRRQMFAKEEIALLSILESNPVYKGMTEDTYGTVILGSIIDIPLLLTIPIAVFCRNISKALFLIAIYAVQSRRDFPCPAA